MVMTDRSSSPVVKERPALTTEGTEDTKEDGSRAAAVVLGNPMNGRICEKVVRTSQQEQ